MSSLLFTTACNDDFMQKDPIDDISAETYWSSIKDLELYANNLYPTYFEGHGYDWADGTDYKYRHQSVYFFGDEISDNMVPVSYNDVPSGKMVRPVTAGSGGWTWENVRTINIFLNNYEKVVASNEADQLEIDLYAAEIKLFKAMEYFEKVKSFGDVPWLDTELTTTSEELYAAADSREVVMAKVIALMDEAIAGLPAKGSEVSGRVNKDIANHMKARMCLHEGTFRRYHNISGDTEYIQKAADAAWAVMSTGSYSISTDYDALKGLNDPYFNLFCQYNYSGNPEVLMQKEYMDGIIGHAGSRYWAMNWRVQVGATKDLVGEYLCADGRTMYDNARSGEYLKEELTDRDPRLTQTINYPTGVYAFSARNSWEQRAYLNGMITGISQGVVPTGYRICKWYLDDVEDWERVTNGQQACPIYRYAETLLIYAEAKAELGECDQTVLDQTINLLRTRASMPSMTLGDYPNDPELDAKYARLCTYTPSPLLREIRRERRIELAIENFRYDDLMRWAAGKFLAEPVRGMKFKAEDYYSYSDQGVLVTDASGNPSMALSIGDETTSGDIYLDEDGYIIPYFETLPDENRVFESYMYYFPIPVEDITMNPNLTTPWPES